MYFPASYGVCIIKKTGRMYCRCYKRVLKNGKGLTGIEAITKAEYHNMTIEFKPLYQTGGSK